MTCNPNAIACQLEMIRNSIDNPSEFQIWGLVVAISAALASVAVAIVAARIARKANKTAEAAQKMTELAAADAARRERHEFSDLVFDYLIDATRQWDGKRPKTLLSAQWVAIARRSASLAHANESGDLVASSARRSVDQILASPRHLVATTQQASRVSAIAVPESLRVTEWVRDPEEWMAKYAEAVRQDAANDVVKPQ